MFLIKNYEYKIHIVILLQVRLIHKLILADQLLFVIAYNWRKKNKYIPILFVSTTVDVVKGEVKGTPNYHKIKFKIRSIGLYHRVICLFDLLILL